ncbi:unnamed protein product [Miscanthus lutarioriparius]|uniref:RING-type domain-containing protein n=1 Tax=Miscanthus lutarioriparius TaxID=422564 RepID=A0A811MCJ4_9POAL|nr:unnamed protein product [Miscanthus lutarioriparius]
MVVCKCRKATRVYCFVHQVPVCGVCICFPEHQLCVVKNYAEWVVNSEFDWPQHCSSCNSVLEGGTEETTRLGCLHVVHTKCLISHIQNFPSQTAPAGYVCPSCSAPIWPPSSIKDTGSRLHTKLKEAIVQTGLETNVFGNHYVTIAKADTRTAAFASDPLKNLSSTDDRETYSANSAKDAALPSTLHSGIYSSAVGSGTTIHVEPEIVEIEGPSPVLTQISEQESNFIRSPSPHGPGAMTRKGATTVDRQNSEISYYADDEDGNRKKYTKRVSVGGIKWRKNRKRKDVHAKGQPFGCSTSTFPDPTEFSTLTAATVAERGQWGVLAAVARRATPSRGGWRAIGAQGPCACTAGQLRRRAA